MPDPRYRIVVCGSGGVGKSAIVVRFIQGKFVETYDPTIEDSYRKTVDIDNQTRVLDVMDTAGQDEYSSLREQYLRVGQGFIVVYAVTATPSFDATDRFRKMILRCKEADEKAEIPMILAGNKIDMAAERKVTTEEGKKKAEQWKCGFFESSAKTTENIEQIFTEIVRRIDKWRETNSDDNTPKKQRKGCTLV